MQMWRRERKIAAEQIVAALQDMAGLRQSTQALVVEAWICGEVTLGISNQFAIDLAVQRNRAEQQRDQARELLEAVERWAESENWSLDGNLELIRKFLAPPAAKEETGK